MPAVDGGMGDNVCPALYGEKMEAGLANRMRARDAGKVTICGRFCESGDILIRDIVMPKMTADDILAIAVSGAYSIPESMNYNGFYKPAVVHGKRRQGQTDAPAGNTSRYYPVRHRLVRYQNPNIEIRNK